MDLGMVSVLAQAVNVTTFDIPPWGVGVAAFLGLALLLFIITRINIDR
jgi:hypothetical protein